VITFWVKYLVFSYQDHPTAVAVERTKLGPSAVPYPPCKKSNRDCANLTLLVCDVRTITKKRGETDGREDKESTTKSFPPHNLFEGAKSRSAFSAAPSSSRRFKTNFTAAIITTLMFPCLRILRNVLFLSSLTAFAAGQAVRSRGCCCLGRES